jgi:phage anti-repressor protein
MSLTHFSTELAFSLSNSQDEFPVDFDLAWQWLGMSTKRNAKVSLLDCGFIRDRDYKIDLLINHEQAPSTFQSTKEVIRLTVETFKMWGMMSRTEQGKSIREYFLECEKIAKQKTSFESIASEKDWNKLRSDGKQYRRTYTDRIKEAGGKGLDYAKATNEIYVGATGLDAKQIKEQRGIVKSKPARDALNVGELQIVAMTEWHLSEALPNGSSLNQINQASRSQAERLKAALLVF